MAAQRISRLVVRSACGAAVLLLCIGLFAASAAGAQLRGYESEAGYRYVALGAYPQTLEGGREPIVWRVLYADADKAYLASEYVLCNRRIHYDDAAYERNGGDFAATEMYGYLNGEFLSSFTQNELAMLLAGDGGALVSLLSKEDLSNKAYGFTGNEARRGMPTPYALQNGLFPICKRLKPLLDPHAERFARLRCGLHKAGRQPRLHPRRGAKRGLQTRALAGYAADGCFGRQRNAGRSVRNFTLGRRRGEMRKRITAAVCLALLLAATAWISTAAAAGSDRYHAGLQIHPVLHQVQSRA